MGPGRKRSTRTIGANLQAHAAPIRREIRKRHIARAVHFRDLTPLFDGPQSFMGLLVVQAVDSASNRLRVLASDTTFYAAVMANPFLSHYFLGLLHYLIAASRAWQSQEWNVDPASHDDWPDLSLLLYIRNQQDIIVTADQRLRRTVTHVAPAVRLGLAAEL